MSVENVDDMFKCLKENDFEGYLGSIEPESSKLGYTFIVSQQDRKASVPVRVKGKDFTIERKVAHEEKLSDFWKEIVGENETALYLHGVGLKELGVSFGELEKFCHPDGFLYFTV